MSRRRPADKQCIATDQDAQSCPGASLALDRWLRIYLTLLGVVVLDVILFASGAFAGTPEYLSIMQGTLISRLIMSIFALPFLVT